MKIRITVSTNKVGSEKVRTIEVDDDTLEDDIEEIAKDAMFDMISWNWERVDT